jgi:signal transduction histidine kinase
MQNDRSNVSAFLDRGSRVSGTATKVTSDPRDAIEHDRIQSALRDERLRISRELHDGALQSLVGAALQLEALALGLGSEFHGIRRRLREIRQTFLEEERDLRDWIETMKGGPLSQPTTSEPAAQIARLCRRVQRQWGLPVRFTVSGGVLIGSPALAEQIYRLVQEGLANVVKHARARVAHVDRSLLPGRVRIVVEDNGRGFPFHGRFDLPQLAVRGGGPASIMARVTALAGTLVLTSSATGSRVEIELPLRPRAVPSRAQARAR